MLLGDDGNESQCRNGAGEADNVIRQEINSHLNYTLIIIIQIFISKKNQQLYNWEVYLHYSLTLQYRTFFVP